MSSAFPGTKLVDANWNGAPMRLAQNESVRTATPKGSMILAFRNMGATTNDGTLSLASGGRPAQSFDAPALFTVPNVLVHNWQGSNLTLANVTTGLTTPIGIGVYGPGMPGETPKCLPSDGTAVPVQPCGSVQTTSDGGWMRLTVGDSSGLPGLFVVVGGPAGPSGNAYAIGVNAATPAKPPGYYAVTTLNSYTFGDFRWPTVIYVVYFGAGNLVTFDRRAVRRPPPVIERPPAPTVALLALQ